jgi:glucose-1-phosphate adenylyltransferase
MKDVLALLLAGGKIGKYGVLTQNRAKAALPFAGNYRIVDFALTSLKKSRIEQIGLVIQYLPSSLIEHVGVGQPWDLHGYGRTLHLMPPFVGIEEIAWYKGTADALYQNLSFVYQCNPSEVLVLSGEHVYHVDFQPIIASHRDRDADITFVTKELPAAKCTRRFGYVETNEDGRVTRFSEKPESAPTRSVSTGMYIFSTKVFLELLYENAHSEGHNLAKDVLEVHAPRLNSYEFALRDYWEYLESVVDYHHAQLQFMREDQLEMLRSWGVLTNLEYRGVGFAPSAVYGRTASVSNAMVCPSCRVDGTVENSILSPGVVVSAGAVVRNSVVMHDCTIGEGAILDTVISDKDVSFLSGARVGGETGAGLVESSVAPLTLVGKGAIIGKGLHIPRGSQVRPGRSILDQSAVNAESGAG